MSIFIESQNRKVSCQRIVKIFIKLLNHSKFIRSAELFECSTDSLCNFLLKVHCITKLFDTVVYRFDRTINGSKGNSCLFLIVFWNINSFSCTWINQCSRYFPISISCLLVLFIVATNKSSQIAKVGLFRIQIIYLLLSCCWIAYQSCCSIEFFRFRLKGSIRLIAQIIESNCCLGKWLYSAVKCIVESCICFCIKDLISQARAHSAKTCSSIKSRLFCINCLSYDCLRLLKTCISEICLCSFLFKPFFPRRTFFTLFIE